MTNNPSRPPDATREACQRRPDRRSRPTGCRAMLKGTGSSTLIWPSPSSALATTWIETMPSNLNVCATSRIDVKRGIRDAGATPMEFNTIAVSDGVSMGTSGMRASLVSREVIADLHELVACGHLFDGLVCLVACDKTTPGAVMALRGSTSRPSSSTRARSRPVSTAAASVDRRRLRGDRRVRGRGGGEESAEELHELESVPPRRGSVRRPVHRQHDVDHDRLPRSDTAGCERIPP